LILGGGGGAWRPGGPSGVRLVGRRALFSTADERSGSAAAAATRRRCTALNVRHWLGPSITPLTHAVDGSAGKPHDTTTELNIEYFRTLRLIKAPFSRVGCIS